MGTSAAAERRHVPRRPFRGTVELALGSDPEAYEADAVDLSAGGMSLTTAFLPDIGSELECRFALEDGAAIAARAEVVWAKDTGAAAGAFGLRFTGLAGTHEQSIRDSFVPGDFEDPAVDEGAFAAQAKATASVPSPRARLFIQGMDAPLRTKVRTRMDDAVVLGSELSFLKLGERVEIEHDGDRIVGAFEDVAVEVDPKTQMASLVLTVALDPAAATSPGRSLPPPGSEPAGPSTLRKTVARVAAPIALPQMLPPADHEDPRELESHHSASESDLGADAAGMHPALDADTAEALASDPGDAVRRAPPAWLVGLLATVRSALRAVIQGAGPLARRLWAAMTALVVRMRKTRAPSAVAVQAPKRALAGGLRKQHVTEEAVSEEPTRGLATKKYGLYGLAALGVVAIVVALVTGERAPRARTPRPQVAVAPSATTPAPAAEPTAPEGLVATGDPAAAMPSEAAAPTTEPAPASDLPSAPTTPAAAAPRMPSDLVAAARSRNARVAENLPSISRASAVRPTPRAVVATATPAAASTSLARMLGNAAVRTGTMLRLRMDGPIAGISGGPSGNALIVRIPGHRSLDLAAPLVRQDARLASAAVYNRGGNAELTLRFRDALPNYSARVRGDTLEIVLAPSLDRRAPAPVAARSTALFSTDDPVITLRRRDGR